MCPRWRWPYYEILKAGGYSTGGTNFDAKLRRQSLDAEDLVAAHVGGMDVCAAAFKQAWAMLEDGSLEAARAARYAGWTEAPGTVMLDTATLESIHERVVSDRDQPQTGLGRGRRSSRI